jgi:hypothetical protein
MINSTFWAKVQVSGSEARASVKHLTFIKFLLLPQVTDVRDVEKLAKDVASLDPKTFSRKVVKCLTRRTQISHLRTQSY